MVPDILFSKLNKLSLSNMDVLGNIEFSEQEIDMPGFLLP